MDQRQRLHQRVLLQVHQGTRGRRRHSKSNRPSQSGFPNWPPMPTLMPCIANTNTGWYWPNPSNAPYVFDLADFLAERFLPPPAGFNPHTGPQNNSARVCDRHPCTQGRTVPRPAMTRSRLAGPLSPRSLPAGLPPDTASDLAAGWSSRGSRWHSLLSSTPTANPIYFAMRFAPRLDLPWLVAGPQVIRVNDLTDLQGANDDETKQRILARSHPPATTEVVELPRAISLACTTFRDLSPALSGGLDGY